MRGMRWSSPVLHDTPDYEKRFCYDFLCIINEHEQDQAAKAERRRQPQPGATGG